MTDYPLATVCPVSRELNFEGRKLRTVKELRVKKFLKKLVKLQTYLDLAIKVLKLLSKKPEDQSGR